MNSDRPFNALLIFVSNGLTVVLSPPISLLQIEGLRTESVSKLNSLQPLILDKIKLYVYTYNMSNYLPVTNLAITTQVPATCMGLHIRRASRILTQVYDDALRSIDLEINQFTLLVAVHLFHEVSITRLAQELFTDQTTITRNIKVLEKRGFVATHPGKDRRIKLVSLTIEGQMLLERACPLWEQVQADLKQHFGSQKWQTLLSLLSEVKSLN